MTYPNIAKQLRRLGKYGYVEVTLTDYGWRFMLVDNDAREAVDGVGLTPEEAMKNLDTLLGVPR